MGSTFGPRYWWKTGRPYEAARPSKKSIQRLTTRVYDFLQPHEMASWPEVRGQRNAKLRGWHNYFRYGTVSQAYQIVNNYVAQRVRHFLRRRHIKTRSRCTRRFPSEKISGSLGVHRLARL